MRRKISNPVIELTRKGVFQIRTTTAGPEKRKRVARSIRLQAIGRRETDQVTFAQIRFRTIYGQSRTEFFEWSLLLPRQRHEIKTRLADLGYEWPEDDRLSSAILKAVAQQRPMRRFLMVRAPGWYGPRFVLPDQVFASAGDESEIYIDPQTDAHIGAFIQGEGSLEGWKEFVAKPSCKSSRLRLSIAAGFAAPLLRPFGLDLFGINWFSDTSDGKTLCLFVLASVGGLIGAEGLPVWADFEAAIEDQARGHRDGAMPFDELADGEHQMQLETKARMIAFLVARNRPRKLSVRYERSHNLTNREYRIILFSTSERALGQIARAAGKGRLGGEEVRFIDIPASEPGSAGIFDGKIEIALGKTLRETTKDLVEQLKSSAIKHQGYPLRAYMRKYVNDPNGLETAQKYKRHFEAKAKINYTHNAHLRIRSNFALLWAAAALAIDYEILPWKKEPTFRAIEKCMHLALGELEAGTIKRSFANKSVDARRLSKTLKEKLDQAKLLPVKLKQRVTKEQARIRQAADGFVINGEILLRPDRLKSWIPDQSQRLVLRENKIIRTEREDTSTVERKIGGIEGKPRYYAINVRALNTFASERSS